MTLTKNEYEYARLVAAESQKTFPEVMKTMTAARDEHGVSFQQYCRMQLYKFTEKTVIYQGERLKKLAEDTDRHYDAVSSATGRSRGQIQQDLTIMNENPYAKIDIAQYAQLKLYELDRLALEEMLIAIRDRRILLQQLTKMLQAVDVGTETYENVAPVLENYYHVTKKTLLQSDIEEVQETIEKSAPYILRNQELLKDTVTDMLVCKRLMGFWDFEYFMFGFPDKSLPERRTYVSNNYRTTKLLQVNDRIKSELFDNKAQTYEVFKDFYGREAVIIHSEEDLGAFRDFCAKHDAFVKKPLNGAMGSGIGLVNVAEYENVETLLAFLLGDIGPFICEELIHAHPSIRKLNPDSVNTVRLSTYFDGKTVHMKWPFMKIGRSGSFVDNGGAGGILVAISEETGTFISAGMDEACSRYEVHPDNGTVLPGYQLPDWQSALDLGKRLAMHALKVIPEVRFIGWDITYTQNNEWVVIEGNAFSQFIGQQAPIGRGVRAELDAMIVNS